MDTLNAELTEESLWSKFRSTPDNKKPEVIAEVINKGLTEDERYFVVAELLQKEFESLIK